MALSKQCNNIQKHPNQFEQKYILMLVKTYEIAQFQLLLETYKNKKYIQIQQYVRFLSYAYNLCKIGKKY